MNRITRACCTYGRAIVLAGTIVLVLRPLPITAHQVVAPGPVAGTHWAAAARS
jgi:hypothetical protein